MHSHLPADAVPVRAGLSYSSRLTIKWIIISPTTGNYIGFAINESESYASFRRLRSIKSVADILSKKDE